MARQGLGDLQRILRRTGERIERNADQLVRSIVRSMGPALGYSTPVDTSRARANWQAAINSQPTNILYAKPDAPPSPDIGARLAIQSLDAAANAYRQGATVYVVNNTPYIRRLNAGWSAQAPAGFVQIAIHVAIRTARNTRLLR